MVNKSKLRKTTINTLLIIKFSFHVVIIISFLIMMIAAILYINNDFQSRKYCHKNGYDAWDGIKKVEPGYIICCQHYYEDHIAKEHCEVIKDER